MLFDADDWVDRRVVAAARAGIGLDANGGLVEAGFAIDFRTLRAVPVPHPGVFSEAFHRICGSSTVAVLAPGRPTGRGAIRSASCAPTIAGSKSRRSSAFGWCGSPCRWPT